MKALLTALFVLTLAILCATPRGLTSRELPADGEISVVQPPAVLDVFSTPPAEPQSPFGIWDYAANMSVNIVLPANEQVGVRYIESTGRGEFFSSTGPETWGEHCISALYGYVPSFVKLFSV
ncbi:MAG TPA: hypothetical protein PKI59_04280 [Candidatus Cloacimonadota bacterium]|nr:hypothetical protein [Candidatus Cloacimonadota bacterium]